MPVNGIGGIFFRAKAPDVLRAWYEQHLGISLSWRDPWQQAAGQTLIVPFAEDTDNFPADKQWMINFRVSDIDGLIAGLKAAGIAVKTDPAWDTPETGRFARIHDPEGNAIELWEPPAE